jgi:predicted NAD/FAD-binding protein
MRVAVVGGGVAGLGAAWALDRVHEVELFEREPTAGGHVNTVLHDGFALDTGFIVSNVPNYPLLGRLFRELGIRTQPSEMSFSVACAGCGLEYSGRRPFAQPQNAASPRFLSLVGEIGRWLATAHRSLGEADYERRSLAAWLDERRYSQRFREHFLVPLTAALWSAPPGRALELPAAYAIQFFANHGMLGLRRFRWQTVTGGSHRYVAAIAARLRGRVRTDLPVRSLRRGPEGVELRTEDDRVHAFDAVVVASHADEALALLEDPSREEREILGAFGYTRNAATLHTDSSFLPRTPAARASWNYRTGNGGRPAVSYWLNRLQRLDAERDYVVTLNDDVPEEHALARFVYDHPLFTVETLAAQRRLGAISGRRRTEFAGAYQGNGFHEDGLASGLRAAAALGAPW